MIARQLEVRNETDVARTLRQSSHAFDQAAQALDQITAYVIDLALITRLLGHPTRLADRVEAEAPHNQELLKLGDLQLSPEQPAYLK